LDAHQKHNKAHFVFSDDGSGIDPDQIRESLVKKKILDISEAQRTSDQEIIRYIFYPGFSTKDNVSEISGRGVGMDVVQNTIQNLGGQITVESEKGAGTTFRITLPLTLAIIHGLVTQVNNRTFIIPINYVEEVIRCQGAEIRVINKKPHIIVREALIPLVNLTTLLYGRSINLTKSKKLFVVVVNYNDRPTGIVVDKLMGEEEIVIKNIDYAADQYYIIHSATIMGTGDVGLILDIASLLDYLTMRKEDSSRIILSETHHENTHR
jgi:two-component system chemotaxis sensor kinase CheA